MTSAHAAFPTQTSCASLRNAYAAGSYSFAFRTVSIILYFPGRFNLFCQTKGVASFAGRGRRQCRSVYGSDLSDADLPAEGLQLRPAAYQPEFMELPARFVHVSHGHLPGSDALPHHGLLGLGVIGKPVFLLKNTHACSSCANLSPFPLLFLQMTGPLYGFSRICQSAPNHPVFPCRRISLFCLTTGTNKRII